MNLRLTSTAAIATIAASIALHPLLASSTWFWEGAGAVIVVAGVGSLTRLRPLPVLVCLVVTAAGLLLYVNLVFSGQRSLGGLLPTPTSLAELVQLIRTGWEEAARFAPPVPGLRGVTLLAVAGIGLAALFTDLLGVRLRQAAAAGLPLLALFSATVASRAAEPAIYEAAIFCAGVAGYLALLVADGRERIQLWGQLVSIRQAGWPWPGQRADQGTGAGAGQRPGAGAGYGAGQGPGYGTGRAPGPGTGQRPDLSVGQRQETPVPDTSALAAAGRRVGMAAIAAALLVPLLIPGLHVRDLLGSGQGAGGQGGGAVATLPYPVVQLDQQLHRTRPRTILTYHTDNSTMPPYLRVYTLDLSPTATTWSLYLQQVIRLPGHGAMPGAPGFQHDQSHLIRASVTVVPGVTGTVFGGGHTENFLPLPYPAVKVQAPGDWGVDPETLMVWSPDPISALKYAVTSRDVDPSPQQLRAAPGPPRSISAAEQALPPAYNSLLSLARQITRNAPTPYDKALALQQWFTTTGGFSYSLDASEPNTVAGLDDFLLQTKRGFCQQFAFAFAVLARLLDIPARVAVGYTAGTDLGKGNWRVTTSDAHAWPELYFQGAGWLPWEPTPSGTGVGQGTASTPDYSVSAGSSTGPGGGQGQTTPRSTGAQQGKQHGSGVSQEKGFVPDQGPAGIKLAHQGHRSSLWWLLAAGVLGLIIMILPLTTRLVTRMWRMMIIARGAAPGRPRSRAVARRAGSGRTGSGRAGTAPAGTGPAGTGPAGTGPAGTGPAGSAGTAVADAAASNAAAATRARAHAAWLEVHDDLEDFGLGCPGNESPRAVVHRVSADLQLPQAPRDALGRVAFAEERARYAATVKGLPTLRADVTTIRRAVAASVDVRARWRARVFPASKLSALRRSSRHALDVFGWLEVATSRLSDHLRPGKHPEMDNTAAP